MRLKEERRRRERLENEFNNRVDKTILRAIYTEDHETIKKICSENKY